MEKALNTETRLSRIRQLPPHPEKSKYTHLFALKPFKYTKPDGKVCICPEASVVPVLETKREGEARSEKEIILSRSYRTPLQFSGYRGADELDSQKKRGPIARVATEEETKTRLAVEQDMQQATSVLG